MTSPASASLVLTGRSSASENTPSPMGRLNTMPMYSMAARK